MLGLERLLQSNYHPASEITPSATYFPIRPAHSTRWPLLLCPFPASIFLHLPIDFLFADFVISECFSCYTLRQAVLRVTHGTAHHTADASPPYGIAADAATVLREFTNRSIAKEGFLPQSLGDRATDPEAARFLANGKAVFFHL